MTLLPTNVAGGQSGHVDHTNQVHAKLNKLGVDPVADGDAVGDASHSNASGTDDTAAIQAKIDEAVAAGVPLTPPPGRTFKITSTLFLTPDTSKPACSIVGRAGTGGNLVTMLPTFVWGGAAGGTMFDISSTGNNIGNCRLQDFKVMGRSDLTDHPGTLIRWGPHTSTPSAAAKPDTGSSMQNVHLAHCSGDAVRFEGTGLTNFFVDTGRMDNIGGYGFYCRVASHTGITIRNYTWDAWGTPGTPAGKGFIHFDATGGGTTALVDALFENIHTEHSSLVETDASASEVAGRRGIYACTIDSTTGVMHFNLTMLNPRVLGWNASDLSASLVQMLGGTAAQRRGRLILNAFGVRQLSGDGTASTGHVIAIGNCGQTPGFTSGPYSEIHFAPGGGGIFGTETPRVWTVAPGG